MKIRRLDEFSLVDRPANPLARVVLTKRLKTDKGDAKPFAEMRGNRRARDEVWQFTSDLADCINRAMDDEDVTDKGAFIEQSLTEFVSAVQAALPNWTAGKPMEKEKKAEAIGLLTKVAQALGLGSKDIEKLETPEGEKPVADKPAAPAAPAAETVSKAEMEALTKRLEKAEADAKANAEKVEKLQSEQRLAEFSKRATEYAPLPVKVETFAPILMKAADVLTEDENKELDRVLRAAAEAMTKAGVMKEIGSGAAEEGTAAARVAAKLDELKKAHPNKSEAALRAEIWKNDPKLRAAYEAEQSAGK